MGEVTAGDEVSVWKDRQGPRVAVQAVAQGFPGAAVPSRDVVGVVASGGGEPAAGDRTRRVAFDGTEMMIDADLVVPAIGEVVDPTGFETLLGRRSYIPADARGAVTETPGVFAGGDALGGRGTVSAAIGDGRRAAEAIGRFIRDESERWSNVIRSAKVTVE